MALTIKRLDSDTDNNMTESDHETIAIRRAIESSKLIEDLEEYQLVHGSNGYSVVRYCDHGNKYYAYAADNEDEARADDSRILDTPAVSVSDDDENYLSECACGGE